MFLSFIQKKPEKVTKQCNLMKQKFIYLNNFSELQLIYVLIKCVPQLNLYIQKPIFKENMLYNKVLAHFHFHSQ